MKVDDLNWSHLSMDLDISATSFFWAGSLLHQPELLPDGSRSRGSVKLLCNGSHGYPTGLTEVVPLAVPLTQEPVEEMPHPNPFEDEDLDEADSTMKDFLNGRSLSIRCLQLTSESCLIFSGRRTMAVWPLVHTDTERSLCPAIRRHGQYPKCFKIV